MGREGKLIKLQFVNCGIRCNCKKKIFCQNLGYWKAGLILYKSFKKLIPEIDGSKIVIINYLPPFAVKSALQFASKTGTGPLNNIPPIILVCVEKYMRQDELLQ